MEIVNKKTGKDSGRNTPVQNDEEIKDDPSVGCNILGDENCSVSPEDTEIEYCMIFSIGKIANIEKCVNLRRLGLRKNRIRVIENLTNNVNLEELELYDNLISKIENIGHLKKLQILDLSFNRIRKFENVEYLPELKKVFASSNKIEIVIHLTYFFRWKTLINCPL